MLYAGISWDTHGFQVEVVDGTGCTVRPAIRIPAERADEITVLLGDLGESTSAVIDSTNGLLDGRLTAAGVAVYRADPWVLPERPLFGSVAPGELARAGQRDLSGLTRLDLAHGTLGGRGDDLNAGYAASTDAVVRLTAAGRCLTNGDRARRQVALTFDDGPLPPYTGRILGILDRYRIPATFFCVGMLADAHPEGVAEISQRGHGLGNHTWSHPLLPELTRSQVVEQVRRAGEAIARAAGGDPPTLFRPPYGGRSPQVLRWLAELDSTVVLWDVMGFDWALPGERRISQSILDSVQPGSVVLLHDGGGDRQQTVDALPAILDSLIERGFDFVTVEDLLPTPQTAEAR